MDSGQTFQKRERIVSQKLMEQLFDGTSSHSMSVFPLRVVFMTVPRTEGACPVQILVSVPKRRFKHAVDRNRVKRQVREAFRKTNICFGLASPTTSSWPLLLYGWLMSRCLPHVLPIASQHYSQESVKAYVNEHSKDNCSWTVRNPIVVTLSAYHILSAMHLTADTIILPFYPHLFTICQGGTAKAWTHQGPISCHPTYPEVQPLGRFWL